MAKNETSESSTPTYSAEVLAQAKKQLEIIRRGVEEIIPEAELFEKLCKSLSTAKPLRVKLGVDPTRPDLHLGHTVVMQKLKDFQDCGHQVIFLIGDFTAQIGDPSGRSETRKPLSKDEIKVNAKTYADQALKILNPSKTQIVFNSQWCDKLSITDVIKLSSQMTVARMIERDDFSKRYGAKEPIALHEFLYPIMQAYDSVQLRSDVELGGTDQKFNVLLGRDYQKVAGQDPQVVIMMPILEGLDGKLKMSKSYDNYIGVTEDAGTIFGKVMSISDQLMARYYVLLTQENMDDVAAMHPKAAKVKLAKILVERFHGAEAADKAAEDFESVFAKGQIPEDTAEITLESKATSVVQVIVDNGLAPSMTEARRLISQGAVTINGEKVGDIHAQFKQAGEALMKVGKRRFLKIKIQGH
ncbi:MAG TPA: tyrosine--tRNA ligase [Bdellovibrionota bacterium]|nr:tyrosine--tRNA ligase [Bdellovibrionota bacterium]